MKRILILLMAVILLIGLCACGRPVDAPMSEDTDLTPETADPLMTLDEIHALPLPSGYTYTITDRETETVIETGEYSYKTKDADLISSYYLWDTNSEVLLSSNIEDDMIYNLTSFTMDNGAIEGQALYIVDPETHNFVAASIEIEGRTTLYQFIYG